ncbi:MAG: hypothetical protein C4555_02915 [Dehalococcoidia bacterium]|jgi:hypothetical protein|nr:MAG: hypothetical protein C4555_02915 [Dehalococcoidia bacterium]
MVLELLEIQPSSHPSNRVAVCAVDDIQEFVAICPGCKTLETLSFNNGWLMQTRKFNQRGKMVFHDCGTSEPCHLYRYSC